MNFVLTEAIDYYRRQGAPGDQTYSKEERQNVLAVGRALADALKQIDLPI